MPAPIPPALQLQIAELRRRGVRYKDIAEKVGVSVGTARRYGNRTDADLAISREPAGRLTAGEVSKLKYFLAKLDLPACPKCRRRMISFVYPASGHCEYCGTRWSQ